MDSMFLIILILVAVALLIYVMFNRSRSKNEINEANEYADNGQQVDLNTRLKNLILDGQMIKAVKEYRVATGTGLMEAKNYVDTLAAAIKEGKSIEDYKKPELNNEEIEARVRKLVSQGQKIGAVKAYREATGCDLLTAKKYVDSIE